MRISWNWEKVYYLHCLHRGFLLQVIVPLIQVAANWIRENFNKLSSADLLESYIQSHECETHKIQRENATLKDTLH